MMNDPETARILTAYPRERSTAAAASASVALAEY